MHLIALAVRLRNHAIITVLKEACFFIFLKFNNYNEHRLGSNTLVVIYFFKVTVETAEKCVKSVHSNKKDIRATSYDVVLVSLLLVLNKYILLFLCFRC